MEHQSLVAEGSGTRGKYRDWPRDGVDLDKKAETVIRWRV
jgi:hypothetical protein